jgi:melibiose permease/lactose/raffinose/galactose permease
MGHGRVQNRFAFGLGTVGRDMLFATVNMFLLVYLTEILDLPDAVMWYMTGALTILRIFDALNDPIMGVLVDNTHSRHGKFKPWIAIGGLAGGLMTVLLFSDLGFRGLGYVASFVVIYLLGILPTAPTTSPTGPCCPRSRRIRQAAKRSGPSPRYAVALAPIS